MSENGTKFDEAEPLDAILAEMSDGIHTGRADIIDAVNERLLAYAGRIKAAVKREREAARPFVGIDLAKGKLTYTCVEIAPGNAAAMRAALEKAHNNIKKAREFIAWQSREDELLMEAQQEIKTALAEPARNCDRFATAEEARDAVKAAFANTMLLDDRQLRAVCDWLFAPAKKGGTE